MEKKKTHPQKLAPPMALKRYPRDLIGRAKLYDISAANQNQGSKYIFSPGISRLPAKKAHLQRAVINQGKKTLTNENQTRLKIYY